MASRRSAPGQSISARPVSRRSAPRKLAPCMIDAVRYDPERLSMERSATAFTAADRIGQLAVQINDIADTRALLERQGYEVL